MERKPCPNCEKLQAKIEQLEQRLAQLESENQQLKNQKILDDAQQAQLELQLDNTQKKTDRLDRELRNLNPSSKPKIPPPDKKEKSTRKRGGQPGHEPHQRELLPAEKISKTVPYVPSNCEKCGHALPADQQPGDPEPTRHQILIFPKIEVKAEEHQGHARTCPCCSHITQATIPNEVRKNMFDTGFVAFLGMMVVAYKMSRRNVVDLLQTIFDTTVSLGTISNYEQEMNDALNPVYQEAHQHVKDAEVKHIDETSWKEAGAKRWLWVVATMQVVMFAIRPLRSWIVAAWLLGSETLKGIVTSDRMKAYRNIPLMQRQICWAHLKRNFEKLAKRSKKAKQIAEQLLEIHRRVFHEWHLYRGGTIDYKTFDIRMCEIMFEMLAILQHGSRCRDGATLRFCRNLLKDFPALWTFVVVRGVEPTNNHGERVHRHAVIWRKNCYGCQSAGGCRFAERMLTVVQSLRLQKRGLFAFLREAVEAFRKGTAAPKLVGG